PQGRIVRCRQHVPVATDRESDDGMDGRDKPEAIPHSNFRTFFFRGLAIVLPTVLTIWILSLVYSFVSDKIAEPINAGIRAVVVATTPWPAATDRAYSLAEERLTAEQRAERRLIMEQYRASFRENWSPR